MVSTRRGLPRFPKNLVEFESPLQISSEFVLAYFGLPKRITRTKKYSSIRTRSHRKKCHQRETMTMEYNHPRRCNSQHSNIFLWNSLTAPLWPVILWTDGERATDAAAAAATTRILQTQSHISFLFSFLSNCLRVCLKIVGGKGKINRKWQRNSGPKKKSYFLILQINREESEFIFLLKKEKSKP